MLDGNIMPHVSDKRALRTVAKELGVPLCLLRRQAGNRRLDLDAQADGQREFNGLMFRCFSTSRIDHPWDWATGRSFIDLQGYMSWATACGDQFVIMANAHERVAAYLLPFTRKDRTPRDRIAGIPGLRLVRVTTDTLLFQHLPTGGKLVVKGSVPSGMSRTQMMDGLVKEVEAVRDVPGNEPLFRNPEMTTDETHAYTTFHSHSELLAGLAARVGLWWHHGTEMHLRLDHQRPVTGTLSWREYQRQEPILQKLASPLFLPPHSHVVTNLSPGSSPCIHLRGETLRLDSRVDPHEATAGAL